MDAVEGRLDRLEGSLERLAAQVAGDGSELHPGIVGVLSRQAKKTEAQDGRLDRVERTLDRARWTVGAAATAGSFVGGGAVYLITILTGSVPT